MPIYPYRCTNCNAEVEVRQSFTDAPLTTCELCGGALRRVISPVGVIFKGSGFYSTDNRAAANAKRNGEERGADGKEAKPAAATDGATTNGEKPAEKSTEKPAEKATAASEKASAPKAEPAATAAKSPAKSSAKSE